MKYAKSITIGLCITASLITVSYGTIYAYKYATTTTLEDISKQAEIFEKAKSDMEKIIIKYCNDSATGKVDYDKCEKEIDNIGTGKLAPTPSEPPSQKVGDSEQGQQYSSEMKLLYGMGLGNLYKKVCQKQVNSPLCKDRKLFDRLYQLTEERLPGKNFYPILLGITNAESSLGLNFAKDRVGGTCAGRNNWGGVKWRKSDTGESIKDQGIPDKYGCYLYKFDSIEDYWISKVNTISYGYKGCIDSPTPVRCISYAYIGDRNIAEDSWIRNVSVFLN